MEVFYLIKLGNMYIVQLQYLFAHKQIIWSLGILDVSIRSDGSWINSSQQDATNTKDTRYYRKSNCYAFNYEIFLLSYPQYFLSLQSSQRSVSFYFPYPSPECNRCEFLHLVGMLKEAVDTTSTKSGLC